MTTLKMRAAHAGHSDLMAWNSSHPIMRGAAPSFWFSGPYHVKRVTLGDEPKTNTVRPGMISGVASRDRSMIMLLGSGNMTPSLQNGFMKGRCDKRRNGERQQDRIGNGWIDFNDKRNFPDCLTKAGEANTFQSSESRGSDHSELVDVDKATIELHARPLVYFNSLN